MSPKTFQGFLEVLKSPQPKEIEYPAIQVYVQEVDGSFKTEPMILNNVPSYFTITDIYRLLWLQKGESDEWHPSFVFLGVPLTPGPPTSETMYENALGLWYLQESQSVEDSFRLPNPINVMQANTPFTQFVDVNGARLPVTFRPRDRTKIEDVFKYTSGEGSSIVLHAYSLTYLQREFSGEKPYSSRIWNGLFLPYFPTLNETGPFEPTSEIKASSEEIKTYIKLKLKESKFLMECLETGNAIPLKSDKLRHLQFSLPTPEDFTALDAYFFTVPTTKSRPYLRYLPPSGSPMTKLYRVNALSLPEVSDCETLRTWNSLNIPPQNFEIVYAKILAAEIQQQPLYATLRVLENGNADITIQPFSNTRDIDMEALEILEGSLTSKLTEGLLNTGYDLDKASFQQASIHLGYKLDEVGEGLKNTKNTKGRRYKSEISKQVLRDRLKRFHTLLQEIEPHEDDQAPSLMLRYKGVSNFENEDRISAFLTFQSTKKLLQGSGISEEIVKELALQFGLSTSVARERVASWLSKKTEVSVSDPESKDTQHLYNPGTDIAIYLQHPYYKFHIYRVESISDFEIIQSLLSILFTLEDDVFEEQTAVSAKAIHATNIEEAKSAKPIQQDTFEPPNTNVDDYMYLGLEDEIDETQEDELDKSSEGLVTKPSYTQQQQIQQQESKTVEEDTKKPIVALSFYIDRLKALDPTLFKYEVKTKAEKNYSSLCPANDTRQPLAMTADEYERMKRIYKQDLEDKKMIFIEYGGDDLAQQQKDAKDVPAQNRFTILKYGSSETTKNYYICALYFCLRDYLILLPDEFKNAGFYRGHQKPAKSCPFCKGSEIPHEKLASPGIGQTVLAKRIMHGSDNKFHTFVRFLKDSKHPNRLDLPCCFLKEPNDKERARLELLSVKKAPKRKAASTPAAELIVASEEEGDESEEEITESTTSAGIPVTEVNYGSLQTKVSQLYVLDAAKYPLPPGKLGSCGPSLDSYFSQNSDALITREVIKQQVLPNATGFLRLGVDNPPNGKDTSLFAALSPVLGLSSWVQVARKFHNEIQPRRFINLNFGNLLLEFYNLSVNSPIPGWKNPEDAELSTWASLYIKSDITENKQELLRFFKAYRRFEYYLFNPKETKQLRHFVHALNEPGVMTEAGISIITLEYLGNPTNPSTEIKVRCPTYGFDVDRYDSNEIVFLTNDAQGYWEPLTYVGKTPVGGTKRFSQSLYYSITFSQLLDVAPEIVRQRRKEFFEQCKSSYRGIYTSQSYIDSRLLVPISSMFAMFRGQIDTYKVEIIGLVRDAYNHLVAMTVAPLSKIPSGNPKGKREIVIPIADDGFIAYKDYDLIIHTSWSSVESNLASANEVYEFYKTIVEKKLVPISEMYTFHKFRRQTGGPIQAFQLGLEKGRLLLLPCGPEVEAIDDSLVTESVEEVTFEYEREYNLIIPEDTVTKQKTTPQTNAYQESELTIKKEEGAELYQQFRLTFANWIASESSRSDIRERLRAIYEKRAPLLDKRNELEVILGSILRSWLFPDPDYKELRPTFLRTDCLKFKDNEEACSSSARCIWKTGSDTPCRLHTPENIPVSNKLTASRVDVVFPLRLYDELLRLPAQRYELLNKAVRQIQVIKSDIQIGDQYLVPDSVPAYEELFQKLCKPKISKQEEPIFYEEFSSDEKQQSNTYKTLAHIKPLPQSLADLFEPEYREQLSLRSVGPPQGDNTLPIIKRLMEVGVLHPPLSAFDVPTRTKELFTPRNLFFLSTQAVLPVVQLLANPQPGQPQISSGVFGLAPKNAVIVVVPDAPDGPAILTVTSQLSNTISRDMLRGKIESVLSSTLPIRRTFKVPTPTPSTPSEN